MEKLNLLELGDLGIKSYEHLFQKKIEEAIEKELNKEICWWEVPSLKNVSIFNRVVEAYESGIEVIIMLHELYEELSSIVEEYIEKEKGVI